MIDLRSDTVTCPTPAMREAMAAAEVGDDVFGEDPTVRRLEERVAALCGKPAALFVPSGTMGNQIGVRLHCQGGDEFLCEAGCHIYNYEQGAYAQLFGVAARPIPTDDGVLTLDHVQDQVRRDNVHLPLTRLLCLENTHNRGAGRALPYDGVVALCRWAADEGLARHLDGARLMNAVVASGISASQWCQHFDTISVCFSKGLGAPIGSAIVGPDEAIARARRLRKALGGGWRQAGILAAGALYALDHHVDRLAEDHAAARILAAAVSQCDGLALDPPHVDTNIVIFRIDDRLGTAAQLVERLRERGVRMGVNARQKVRAVTHLGVSRDEVTRAAEILCETAAG
ncbi:MAG TPA: low-specificity L-threonine aldolase [Lacipirellulaceae bacterium]|nr:low-specificity L-threonine aldolase [Lacipirellulaceae bacterium]